MTKAQITEFKRLAKLKAFKQEGFVYVGKGQNPALKIVLGVSIFKGRDSQQKPASGYNGESFSYDYYIKESDWQKLFGVPVKKVAPKPKAESIDSRVALAKTYIGKNILSAYDPSKNGIVKDFRVIFKISEVENPAQAFVDRFESHLALHGSVVILTGDWSDAAFGEIAFPIDSQTTPKLYVPKVRVNGFDAEEFKTYYKFGCAKISKKMLRDTRDFLSTQRAKDNDNRATCNREVQSVKIGAGDFTLETLNKLNLD